MRCSSLLEKSGLNLRTFAAIGPLDPSHAHLALTAGNVTGPLSCVASERGCCDCPCRRIFEHTRARITRAGELATHGVEVGPCGGNAGHVASQDERGRGVYGWRWLRELTAACLSDDPHDSWSRGGCAGAHGHVPRGLCQGKRPWGASGWKSVLLQLNQTHQTDVSC